MKLQYLNSKIKRFEKDFDESRISKLNSLVLKFQEKFPTNRLQYIDLDDYIYGKYLINNNETFCYWLEKKLSDFGRISGSPCFQYGVWFGTRGNDKEIEYRHTLKYGSNIEDAFVEIKESISQLVQLGSKRDFKGIANNKISNKFKGKILTTYFPDDYLSIYADDYLNDILRYFNLDDDSSFKDAPIYKQKRLIDFKSKNKLMKPWTLMKFAMFLNEELYENYYNKEAKSEDKVPEFPDISLVQPIVIPFKLNKEETSDNQPSTTTHNKKKIDYIKKSIRAKALGDRGEQIVKIMEERFLMRAGRNNLAEKIKWWSKETDGQGYDILSFDIDSSPKQIEVKSSVANPGLANFYLTEFELEVSKSCENYYIYYVFNVDTKSPIVWKIPNPFNPKKKGVIMTPIVYKVKISNSF